MKPNKNDPNKERRQSDIPVAAVEPTWQPTWRWHAKVLAVIYVVLTGAYFAVSSFLSRVPPPYKLREVPKEITPWMK